MTTRADASPALIAGQLSSGLPIVLASPTGMPISRAATSSVAASRPAPFCACQPPPSTPLPYTAVAVAVALPLTSLTPTADNSWVCRCTVACTVTRRPDTVTVPPVIPASVR